VNVVQTVTDDFRARRNLDVYATIGTAVVVCVLAAFDLVSPQRIAALTLAVLAVLAFNTLATRTALESAARGADRFRSNFPHDLTAKREASPDILLIGVSLSRTIETSYGAFERNLRSGHRLRILLTSPQADPAALDARCQLSRPSTVEISQEIEQSLKRLSDLARRTGGNLSVRTTKAALKFGLNYLDVGRRSAELHIQLYSFRLSGESRPLFCLTPQDGEWFDCFATQAEDLWEDADVVDLRAASDQQPSGRPLGNQPAER
jgi:hypothetical protein